MSRLVEWLKWKLNFSCWYRCPVCGFRIRGKIREYGFICGECVDSKGGARKGVGVLHWESTFEEAELEVLDRKYHIEQLEKRDLERTEYSRGLRDRLFRGY